MLGHGPRLGALIDPHKGWTRAEAATCWIAISVGDLITDQEAALAS
jgi:hypothetical protein